MDKTRLPLFLCILLACALARAQSPLPPPLDEEPTPAAAVRLAYPAAALRGEAVVRMFGNRVAAQATEVFRARYREQGQDRLMLAFHITPGPAAQYRCGTCVPALGAALLAPDAKGRWQVQARAATLATGLAGGASEDLQLLQLDEHLWALRNRRVELLDGLESRAERLFVPRGDRLVLALDQGFAARPGPAACGARAAEQGTGLNVLSPSAEGAPRLELVLRFNEGACPAPAPKLERQRLVLGEDGLFKPEE